MLLKLLELINQHNSRYHRSDCVGNGHADPDTQCAEETGKDDQAGDQE